MVTAPSFRFRFLPFVHALALMLALLAAHHTAGADPDKDALRARVAELNHDAELHFGHGEFGLAIAKWTKAFELEHDAGRLYNIARAYRGLGHYSNALDYYDWYLAMTIHQAGAADTRKKVLAERAEIAACQVNPADLEARHRPRVSVGGRTKYKDRVEVRVSVRAQGDMPFTYRAWASETLRRQGESAELHWSGTRRTIPPGEILNGVLVIDSPKVDLSAFDLTIMGEAGGVAVSDTTNLFTTSWDGPPDERIKHTTVSVRGLYGVYLVPDGEGTEATSFAGAGVNVHKGLLDMWGIEADLIAGETGTATLDDGTTRQATFMQFLGQGVVRTGLDHEVSARAGLGFRLVDVDSSTGTGQGAGFQADLVVALGAAYTRRLDNWSFGLDTGLTAVMGRLQTVTFGARIGRGF